VQQVLPLACPAAGDLECPQRRIADGLPIATATNTQALWPMLARKEVAWPGGDHFMEPGETETMAFDFLVPVGTKVVTLLSYFRNATVRGQDVGWSSTTVHEF